MVAISFQDFWFTLTTQLLASAKPLFKIFRLKIRACFQPIVGFAFFLLLSIKSKYALTSIHSTSTSYQNDAISNSTLLSQRKNRYRNILRYFGRVSDYFSNDSQHFARDLSVTDFVYAKIKLKKLGFQTIFTRHVVIFYFIQGTAFKLKVGLIQKFWNG